MLCSNGHEQEDTAAKMNIPALKDVASHVQQTQNGTEWKVKVPFQAVLVAYACHSHKAACCFCFVLFRMLGRRNRRE